MSYVDAANPIRVTVSLNAKSVKEHVEAAAYMRLDTGIIARLDKMVRQEFRRPIVVDFEPYNMALCKQEIADKLRALSAKTDQNKELAARAEAVSIAAQKLDDEHTAMSLLAEVESIRRAAEQMTFGKPSKSNSKVFA